MLGFYNAIELVMETGFAVTAFLTLFLNLILPEEIEDETMPELTARDEHEGDGHAWPAQTDAKGKEIDAENGSERIP